VTDNNHDGIVDVFVDNNGDGLANVVDPKSGGTAAPDTDTDGDGRRDRLDLDSDNDGLTDIIEAGGVDLDANGRQDSPTDTDADGLVNTIDPKTGGTILTRPNTDGDNRPDWRDVDSDNDGVSDALEAGAPDANRDGRIDSFTDTDGDGLSDNVDITTGGTPVADLDSDGDGRRNRLDRDSDNDGIPDAVESDVPDANFDGIVDSYADSDGDGLSDNVDPSTGGTPHSNNDQDGDGTPDRLDINSDGDAFNDWIEGFDDNEDGRSIDNFRARALTYETANGNPGHYPPITGNDLNNNGIEDWLDDSDGDGIGNLFDKDSPWYRDSDGDGIINLVDPTNTGGQAYGSLSGQPDNDNDGLPNYRDLDNQVPLPITELVFTAVKQGLQVRLDWQLPLRDGILALDLERAGDNYVFLNLTSMGVADPALAFRHYDEQPLKGWNNYRLGLYYPDGSLQFSPVRQVYFGSDAEPTFSFYPNPITEVIHLQAEGELLSATLFDMSGRRVKAWDLRGASDFQLDVNDVAAGIYTLTVSYDGGLLSRKVLIQR
jgi:hypothetical protein